MTSKSSAKHHKTRTGTFWAPHASRPFYGSRHFQLEEDQPANEGYVLKEPALTHTRQYMQNRDMITLCGNLFHIMLGTMSSRVIAERVILSVTRRRELQQ